MSLIQEEKAQARGMLFLILIPIALVIFLVMLIMLDPINALLFPQIDNMATNGTLYGAAILKVIIAFIPTIALTLWIYSSILDITKG